MTTPVNVDPEIEHRARAGDATAQIALGGVFEQRNDVPRARGWFAMAVKSGNSEAMRRLGANLLMFKPTDGNQGIAFLRHAADAGDGAAAHICSVLAAQDDALPDRWRVGEDYLKLAVNAGLPLAREEQTLLARHGGGEALSSALPVQLLSESPYVAIVENCAPLDVCDWLIARARPRLHRAVIYNDESGGPIEDSARNNSSVGFSPLEADLILTAMRARIAATMRRNIETLEPTSILHYAPGQRYRPHFDFLDETQANYAEELATRGQRAATFLIYLNDDYVGGETDFPRLKLRHKGKRGDALIFHSLDDTGKPDPRTLHAGLGVVKGEKWIFSQWLRNPPKR
jgi:prolyl 4-hydroxylase